jgi:hypothetical protein
MRTRAGKDYLGKMSKDSEGRDCYSWSLGNMDESYIKATKFNIEKNGHYCRNIPGQYWEEPRCLVASDDNSYVFSECTIDYCGKVSLHH